MDDADEARRYLEAYHRGENRNKKLKARIEALEQLLVCYRIGKNPSEKLHKMLDKTKQELGDT